MNRRAFLGLGLGAAAAAALPSEVWPFRKIFLPMWPPQRWFFRTSKVNGLYQLMEPEIGPYVWYVHPEQLKAIQALELECLRKEIPELLQKQDEFWKKIKRNDVIEFDSDPFFPQPHVIRTSGTWQNLSRKVTPT